MDLSKLKIEAYDVLALIIPGLLISCGLWLTVSGAELFGRQVSALNATTFALLLFVAFAVGHLVQEVGDAAIKILAGRRFFKAGRDRFWNSELGALLRRRIEADFGEQFPSVDPAFDFCLTRISGSFAKRDLFLANSDLCRSLLVVSALSPIPLIRLLSAHLVTMPKYQAIGLSLITALGVVMAAWLFFVRMVRFRELSETPVFHAYLAISRQEGKATAAADRS